MRGNRGYRTFTISCALIFMALSTCLSGCAKVWDWSSDVYADGALPVGGAGAGSGSGAGSQEETPSPSAEPDPPLPDVDVTSPPKEEVTAPPEDEEPSPPASTPDDEGAPDDRKLVALTFDDGPDNKYTSEIMDILKEYKVQATFFVVGLQVEKYPETAKRIVDEGHAIGNHSWSHKDLTKLSSKARAEEIHKTQLAIKDATGTTPNLLRAPYGAISDDVLDAIHKESMKHVYWTVDTRDWAGTSVAEMHENVMENTDAGGVILMHSFGGRKNAIAHTVKLLPSLIADLTAKGYEFVTVDELIDAKQASASVVK